MSWFDLNSFFKCFTLRHGHLINLARTLSLLCADYTMKALTESKTMTYENPGQCARLKCHHHYFFWLESWCRSEQQTHCEMIIPWESSILILSEFFFSGCLWLRDRDNGQLWTFFTVKSRTAVFRELYYCAQVLM